MSRSRKARILSIEEHLVNFQDRAIVLLLNEGLTKEQILALQISDLDGVNLTLRLSPGTDAIAIDEYLKNIIMKAYEEEEYYANNGHSEIRKKLENKSDYVIRFADGVRRDIFGINFRIKNIALRYELQEPYPWDHIH